MRCRPLERCPARPNRQADPVLQFACLILLAALRIPFEKACIPCAGPICRQEPAVIPKRLVEVLEMRIVRERGRIVKPSCGNNSPSFRVEVPEIGSFGSMRS